jgi:ankyrin repeat protein
VLSAKYPDDECNRYVFFATLDGEILNDEVDDPCSCYFLRTPNELMLMFADNLEIRDINALVNTSRVINLVLTRYMYRRAVHQLSRSGRPFFLTAVDQENLTAVKLFIELGASVDMRDEGEDSLPTPLHTCAYHGDIKMAQLLIQNGANIFVFNSNNEIPLHLAVDDYPSDEMLTLLLDSGAEISGKCMAGGKVLRMAAQNGSASMVQLLLDRGAVATSSESNGVTPLHGAARKGTAATVRLLLSAGADIEATDSKNFTPLHWAVHFSNTEVVEALLQSGANVEARNCAGYTPLFGAVLNNRTMVGTAHRILHATPRPKGGFWIGTEECVPSCQYVGLDEPIVDLLLDAGANTLASDNGLSPLDWAMRSLPSCSL